MTPDFLAISRVSESHGPIDLNVAVAGDADDPVILCVHGWPDTWHSWRHQMQHFSEQGYRVAAMDVRGYGGSSRPKEVDAYRLLELCDDTAAVVDALSPDAPVILFGHDWGASISWNTARVHADRVRAVAGLAVPYGPASPGDPMEFWNAVYDGRFFYMKYFQEPGVAEAAFEADVAAGMRKIFYAASADSPIELFIADQPEDAEFFEILVDPDPAPAWMSPAEMAGTIAAHEAGPSHGLFNRYRAQKFDGDDISPIGEPMLAQPTCFIGGADDVVRHFVPGLDVFGTAGAACSDFRGTTIIDGAGHWVQQEQPAATNAALDAFLATLS